MAIVQQNLIYKNRQLAHCSDGPSLLTSDLDVCLRKDSHPPWCQILEILPLESRSFELSIDPWRKGEECQNANKRNNR